MYRVGIIGTENSHAMSFAKQINLDKLPSGERKYPDMQVVGVYGADKATAQEVAEKAGVDFIPENPEELLGRVDAVMVTARKGSEHLGYALPFIEKGMPVFVDKPIASDPQEALEIFRAAKKSGSPITGGSGCKLAYDVVMIESVVDRMVSSGKMITASMNFSADLNSVYDGFYFYAPHLVEMALAAFGYDMKSVRAFENHGCVTVIAHYDRYDLTLHFTPGANGSSCTIYTQEKNIYREIDIALIFQQETENFAHMVRTGETHYSPKELILPIFVIDSILKSLKSGQEVEIPPVLL